MDRNSPSPETNVFPARSERSEPANTGEEHRVGPGRPPKEHRWKKGQSGNPSGLNRKKANLPDLKELLNQALKEPVTLRTGKGAMTTTKAAAGVGHLVTQFAAGDRHARRDLIALAPKLGIDLTAGHVGAIGEAVTTLMSASDEAIIDEFLRRHGVEPKPTEAAPDGSTHSAEKPIKHGPPDPESEK